ncbi:MAG: hypothetical protein U0T11_09175 [Chitinophagaceae bacterium]
MRRILVTFILLTIYFTVIAQTTPARSWVDTEIKYTDSLGKTIKVYNSLPKGGGGYISSGGKDYSYVIFWTRIVNESATPLKMTIKFPADSLSIFPSPNSYIKLLIPSDTMTLEKVSLGDYGLTNLKSILDNGFRKPSILKRTLNPKEEYLFYIPIFIHQARGTARTSFILKGHDLFYRVGIDPYSTLIPCGRIDFKKQKR